MAIRQFLAISTKLLQIAQSSCWRCPRRCRTTPTSLCNINSCRKVCVQASASHLWPLLLCPAPQAPINPSDINTIEGKYPLKPELPGVPGHEGVGVVEAVGPKVRLQNKAQWVLLGLQADS